MRRLIAISSIIVILGAGCAGKGDMTLGDAEKQAFDDLRAEIRMAIDDEDRETRAIALVDELAKELESLRLLKTERRTRGRSLNADYDTTRTEFDAFVSSSDAGVRLNQQRILELRRAFIAMTTPEEWDQISTVRTDAINAAIKSTHSI